MKRALIFWLGGGLAALVAAPLAWYLLSPLWITRAVNEALPTARPVVVAAATSAPPTPTEPMPAATPTTAPTDAPVAEPSPTLVPPSPTLIEPTATPAPQTLAQGAFYNIVHEGEGQAGIYQLADGLRVLRFEDFMVLNGPDLYVYLVPDDPVPNAIGFDFMAYHDLGQLKGNVGDQNYELPADLDLSRYHSVVIWCRAFKVPFAAAPLLAAES
ncbi:MAG: DM13 domain-containing protein [Anaerolineales bacterium]|nr:DM13 domain-containing protein [Anaerolineales bacterium]